MATHVITLGEELRDDAIRSMIGSPECDKVSRMVAPVVDEEGGLQFIVGGG